MNGSYHFSRADMAWPSIAAGALATSLALSASSAHAQTTAASPSEKAAAPQETNGGSVQLSEIIVTAERRSTNVQKTAAAVTVQRGEDLLQRGKFTLNNILETVPNVSGGESEGVSRYPTGNDSPASGITIRGIASNGPVSGQSIPGVTATAVYVDDVYSGLGGGYDIDRVEVLRGPQGTLYGRSATAGLVAIHTRDPQLGRTSADLSVEGGNLDLIHVTGAVNVPIVDDKLALRVAGNHYERDGPDASRGYGAVNQDEGKAKLRFKPIDTFSLLVGGAFQDRQFNNGGLSTNFVAPNTVSFNPVTIGSSKTRFRQVWAQADWDVGGVRLTYLPAYRTWKQDATVYLVGPGGAIIKQGVKSPKDHFLTQELRLASLGSSRLNWQTGLFYYENELVTSNLNTWQSSGGLLFDAEVGRKTSNFGVFAEGTFSITPALRFTGGLRHDKTIVKTEEVYTQNLNGLCNTPVGPASGCAADAPGSPIAGLPENRVSASVGGDAGRRVFNNDTFKARLEYDVAPASLLYASVSSAFLPGDLQIGTGAGGLPTVNVYQAEKLVAYEIGSKNRFLDGRLQVNANVFYYDYGGYQISIQLDARNPASGFLFNVPMRLTGQELEVQFQATPDDKFGLNASHVESRFHDRPPAFAAAESGAGLFGFAPVNVTGLYDHNFRLTSGANLDFHAEGTYRSAYDTFVLSAALAAQGGRAYVRQNDFFQANASATWTSADHRYSVTAYVRNLTDYRFKTYVNLQSITPLQADGNLSDPRTFGAVLTGHF
ncbi:TonB-dependent receptor [Phenylobacterium montanum]|nr:TonB-dependent receptor [Caulobacter sp. S6]